jgi:hypothetical protein
LTNLAGEWRGFNRSQQQDAYCCEIGRSSGLSRAVFWLWGQENRAALPHLKMHTPDLQAGVEPRFRGIPALPSFGILIAWEGLADAGRVRLW